MKLSKHKIDLLREFVEFTCEECKRKEEKVGKLSPHRMTRGNSGGTYILRNIKMVCSYTGKIDGKISCHKQYHQGEFK